MHFLVALKMFNLGQIQGPADAHHVVEGVDRDALEGDQEEDGV